MKQTVRPPINSPDERGQDSGKSGEAKSAGQVEYVAIAHVVRPQGRHGEVVADILTDFPERLESLRSAFLEGGGSAPCRVAIEKVWPHKGRVVFKFSGVDSISDAERFRGLNVCIRAEERVTLPEHSYYVWELEGCRVVREQSGARQEVGVVTAIERTGGADLLHVARAGKEAEEILIPFTQAICTRIDPESKTIVIDPPEDLLELNQ